MSIFTRSKNASVALLCIDQEYFVAYVNGLPLFPSKKSPLNAPDQIQNLIVYEETLKQLFDQWWI